MFNPKMAVLVKKCVVILLVAIIAMLFCSCQRIMFLSQEEENSSKDKISQLEDKSLEERIRNGEIQIEFEETVKDTVATNEIIAIANNYIENVLKENTNLYGSLMVGFNNDTKLWRVVYFPREDIFGGDTWIEISEETRKVVNSGFGE
ncbi:MAG: hypothetical protein E7542_03345 [Ruminococcaceae bacterium]|nr:hypothetical protein [Oscillospiraceae bacterium]